MDIHASSIPATTSPFSWPQTSPFTNNSHWEIKLCIQQATATGNAEKLWPEMTCQLGASQFEQPRRDNNRILMRRIKSARRSSAVRGIHMRTRNIKNMAHDSNRPRDLGRREGRAYTCGCGRPGNRTRSRCSSGGGSCGGRNGCRIEEGPHVAVAAAAWRIEDRPTEPAMQTERHEETESNHIKSNRAAAPWPWGKQTSSHVISGKNKKKKNIWLLLHDHDLELLLLHQIEEEEDLQKKQ